MIQVEANACAKPVIAINAMGFLDTMVHGETAFLAKVAEERKIGKAVFGEGHGIDDSHRIVFPNPRTAEYRASVPDIAKYLLILMQDSGRPVSYTHLDVYKRQCLPYSDPLGYILQLR